jgi:hypothetical protein
MGRFGANVIVFVLNNSGYLIERALEENPNWTYNDLAPWNYAELPKALGCADWFTARVTTLGELDQAMKSARASKSGAYRASSASSRPRSVQIATLRKTACILTALAGKALNQRERHAIAGN